MRCVVLILAVASSDPNDEHPELPPSYDEVIKDSPPVYQPWMREVYPPASQMPPRVAQRDPDTPILLRRDATLGEMPLAQLEGLREPTRGTKSVWGAFKNVRRWATRKFGNSPETVLRHAPGGSSGPSSIRRSRSMDNVLDRPLPSAPQWTAEEFEASPYAPNRQTRLRSEMEFPLAQHQPGEQSPASGPVTRRRETRHDNRDLEDLQFGVPSSRRGNAQNRHDNRTLEDLQSAPSSNRGRNRPRTAQQNSDDRDRETRSRSNRDHETRHNNRDLEDLQFGVPSSRRGNAQNRHDNRTLEDLQSAPSRNRGRNRPRTAQQNSDDRDRETRSRSNRDHETRHNNRDLEDLQFRRGNAQNRHDNRTLEDLQSAPSRNRGRNRPRTAQQNSDDRDRETRSRSNRDHETRHNNRDLEDLQFGVPSSRRGNAQNRHDNRTLEDLQSAPSSNRGRDRPRTAQQNSDRSRSHNQPTSRTREDARNRSGTRRDMIDDSHVRRGPREIRASHARPDRNAGDRNPRAERSRTPVTSRPTLYDRLGPSAPRPEESVGADDVFAYVDSRNNLRQVRITDQQRIARNLNRRPTDQEDFV